MVDLQVLTKLPDGFLNSAAHEMHALLGGPTLLHLKGEHKSALVVSILLHGNETTGLTAVQELLRSTDGLPRDLIVFVGNTAAAAAGERRLDGQPDYNRIWAGGNLPEHRLAQQVLNYLADCNPVAAIDIHNNTGKNPLYACINHIDRRFIQLARRFSDTIVFFSEPHEVFGNNAARYCPSVTLECGMPGDREGIAQTLATLRFALSEFEDNTATHEQEYTVFHTVARMTISEHSAMTFSPRTTGADVTLRDDLDSWNFRWIPPETHFAYRKDSGATSALRVTNDAGRDITDDYFYQEGNSLRTRRAFVPSMLTKDERVIAQDCLGYIMEPYPLP